MLAFEEAIPRPALAANIIRVPIEVSEVGQPIISLTIGGHGPYRFIVDTGSNISGIREDLARELKLTPLGTTSTNGLSGSSAATVYSVRDLAIGGMAPQPTTTLLGLEAYREFDGIIAAGFLTERPSELDFEAREIRIYPNGGLLLAGYDWLDTVSLDGPVGGSKRLCVFLDWEGHRLKCLLDTGSPPELYISGDYVRKQHLWNAYADYRDLQVKGVTGAVTARRLVRASNVNLGSIHYASVYTSLGDPSSHDGQWHDAILGARLLRQFTIVFNGESGVGLKPNSSYDSTVSSGG
jgi:serine protease Do